jgi:hypothetical protein
MTSKVAWTLHANVLTRARPALRRLRRDALWLIGAGALSALPACSSNKNDAGSSALTDGGAKGTEGGKSGGSAFDQCVASLTPVCHTSEMNTAEKMGTPCKATEFIPIPLTDGTQYGPKTIQGGPYGAKTEWNQGANTEFVNPVNTSEPICLPTGIDTFKEPSQVTDDLKNTRGLDYSLYTIFRPACMKDGEKYPVITWANGTCGLTHGYAVLLGTIASHGFVIIASNSTWTNTAPTDSVQERTLDYAAALQEDSSSDLYHRLDLDKIGAMGHSQGAMATVKAAKDPRVKSVIFWNTGVTNEKPFLNVSGDRDVGTPTLSAIQTGTEGATQPGAWVYFHQVLQTGGGSTGHLVLMEQPDRVWEMAVAWWQWQLNGDETSKKMFVGTDCGLCNRAAEFDYGTNAAMK